MKVGIAADIKHAQAIIQAGTTLNHVYSFCPSASHELKKSGYYVVSVVDHYRSLSHARTAIATSGQVDVITDCGQEIFQLAPSERSGFRANLIYTLSTLYYFHYALRHYKKIDADFFLPSGKNVMRYSSYDAMFAALMDYALRRYNHTYENLSYSYLNQQVARMCNRLIRLVAGSGPRVAHFGDALQSLENALIAADSKTIIFKPRTVGKTIFQTLHITANNLVNLCKGEHHIHYFRHTKPSDYRRRFDAEVAEFRAALKAKKLSFPMPIFFERVVDDSGWYLPFLRAQEKVGLHLVKDLKPHLVMTNKGKYHFIRAAISHLQKGKAVSLLINHGTHTAQPEGSISQIAANLWASDDRISMYNLDVMVPRLPLTLAQLKQMTPPPYPEVLKMPTVKRVKRQFGDPKDTFKIMFAGNYIGTISHIPWCTETADEFILNLLELIEKLGAMPKVDFTIKLKARKASGHIAILQERIDTLGLSHKIRIDTTTPYLTALKDTHLVISNLSTTIEEALGNRVPVLLHTHRKHYFHLPAEFSLNQSANPGMVFAIRQGQNIEPMIEAIRTYYQHIVTDEESLGAILWKDNEFNDLQEFASKITSLASK